MSGVEIVIIIGCVSSMKTAQIGDKFGLHQCENINRLCLSQTVMIVSHWVVFCTRLTVRLYDLIQ